MFINTVDYVVLALLLLTWLKNSVFQLCSQNPRKKECPPAIEVKNRNQLTVNAFLERKKEEKMYDQHQFWQQNKSNFFCFFSMHGGMTTTTYIMNQQQMWNLRKWSHHFSTLSEYPIISCCVKTIAVNQARGRRRSYKNNAQRGAAAWEEHSLYGPHWIRLDAATEHICYVFFFSWAFFRILIV